MVLARVFAVIGVAAVFSVQASEPLALDDPGVVSWIRAVEAAQQERVDELAGRNDARSQLIAMQLVHPMFRPQGASEEGLAEERQRSLELLQRAHDIEPENVLVAWMRATCRPAPGPACGSVESVAHLEAVGGADAAVQLWLAHRAQKEGDFDAEELHLQRAADAERYAALELEAGQLIWDAFDGLEIPAPDDLEAYADQFDVDADAFSEQLLGATVIARIAALAMPEHGYLRASCRNDEGQIAAGTPRHQQCLRLYSLKAEMPRTDLLTRLIAHRSLVELSRDSAALGDWREHLRITSWVYESGIPLVNRLSAEHDVLYLGTWREHGEWRALVDLLERKGPGAKPPHGWLPEDPRSRMLITGEAEGGPVARPGSSAG